jgi:hypothetical protein
MKKTFLSIIVFSCIVTAQPFGAGIKLGTTLSDAISAAPSFPIQNSNHFIVGPYVELRLPLGLSVEGDALYLHGLYEDVSSASGSTWQFPILLKFKFLGGPVRPYVEGGPQFSHISDIAEIPELNHHSNFGIVLGGGIEVKVFKLRVSPEVRYNGFALTNIESPTGLFHSNKNLATFTLGVGF